MAVSSLGCLSNSPKTTAETSSETAGKDQTSSNGTEVQVSEEAQTRTLPPVQAPNDFGGKEGSVVTQDNSSSTNTQEPGAESESGSQLDVLA